ncbi:MAG: hypothetical protein KDE54_32130 [Caldilineaceae bacterium]|nr:hypothetical protein [Caldilineaceae bacterium]MCB0140689.1 hypothetical protein [Caldilineaceae bacterium]
MLNFIRYSQSELFQTIRFSADALGGSCHIYTQISLNEAIHSITKLGMRERNYSKMLRITLAVLVGFSVWAALFIGSISLLFKSVSNSLNMAELNNEPSMLIFLILLGINYAVIAGLITAGTANITRRAR